MTRKYRNLILPSSFLAVALGTVMFPVAGQASLLFGTLNISGNVVISAPSGNGRIDFGSTGVGNSGAYLIGTSTGDFAVLAGTGGTEKNIENPPYVTNTAVITPLFISFSAAPNISFTLAMLLGGTQGVAGCLATTPAPGQNCTPAPPVANALSPFNLSNTSATTSTASFTVIGTEVDSLTGTSTPIVGVYSAQFTVPFQTLLNTVNGGGTVNTTYSASFTPTAVPEPGSALIVACGIGLLAFGTQFRRFFPGRD